MTKVAVILSGCGYLDGAEIRESVLSLLYLDEQGAEVQCFAPDIKQKHVINHAKGEPAEEARNVLEEAARIARSKIKPLTELDAGAFDALVIPGGFGVAKNLSDFAEKGADAAVLPDFKKAVEAFFSAGKPIGAICIAPAVVAAALKNKSITLTIGDDKDVAAAIVKLGNKHQDTPTSGYVLDEAHHVVSCSAYMREDPISEVAKGIRQVIEQVMKLSAKQKRAA